MVLVVFKAHIIIQFPRATLSECMSMFSTCSYSEVILRLGFMWRCYVGLDFYHTEFCILLCEYFMSTHKMNTPKRVFCRSAVYYVRVTRIPTAFLL
jgi:hypothetical protein